MFSNVEVFNVIKLWSIYIPGTDEYHPAPSEAIAKHMAKNHNAAMDAFFAKYPSDSKDMVEMSVASVAEWPFDPEDHAAEIKLFDYAGWGLEGGAE